MSRFRLAIVVSRYNRTVTDALLSGALEGIRQRLPDAAEPVVLEAAGSFEILAVSRAAATSGRIDGIVALGCIIKGETSHDMHLATAVTSGLAQLTLHTGIPVGLGVLTVDSVEQARARAGLGGASGKSNGPRPGEQLGNKGREAADALIDTLETIRRFQTDRGRPAPTRRGPGTSSTNQARASIRGEQSGLALAPSPPSPPPSAATAGIRRKEGRSQPGSDRRSPIPDKAARSTRDGRPR